ncbi:hypothetical protein MRX96_032084 [Rhipicephalus microplus]
MAMNLSSVTEALNGNLSSVTEALNGTEAPYNSTYEYEECPNEGEQCSDDDDCGSPSCSCMPGHSIINGTRKGYCA